jgi:hypothetical protein
MPCKRAPQEAFEASEQALVETLLFASAEVWQRTKFRLLTKLMVQATGARGERLCHPLVRVLMGFRRLCCTADNHARIGEEEEDASARDVDMQSGAADAKQSREPAAARDGADAEDTDLQPLLAVFRPCFQMWGLVDRLHGVLQKQRASTAATTVRATSSRCTRAPVPAAHHSC